MKLRHFLDMTCEGSVIHLLSNGRTVLLGMIQHFYQDFDDEENNEYNSYVVDYLDCEVDYIEWTDAYLYVYVNEEE